MWPNPVTTSNTVAGHTPYLSSGGDDGELRAFQNVCRHRGNALCTGAGSQLRELRCGYHGWTWDLQGALRRVPHRKGFGALPMSEFPLIAAQVDTWERFVFVNLDATAVPLRDYLEAVPEDIAWNRLSEFRCYATMTIDVDATWKTIADGFSETYHIQTLHPPELHRCMDDVYAPQTIWGHTGKSEQLYGVPSPHLKESVDDAAVWDAYVCTQGALMGVAAGAPPFPAEQQLPDQSVAEVIAGRTRAFAAERGGVDLAWATDEQIMRLHQYNVFPQPVGVDQRRPPDGADLSPGRRSRPGGRTRHDVVDENAAGCTAYRPGGHATDGRRGPPPRSGSDPGHRGAARRAARIASTGFDARGPVQ